MVGRESGVVAVVLDTRGACVNKDIKSETRICVVMDPRFAAQAADTKIGKYRG